MSAAGGSPARAPRAKWSHRSGPARCTAVRTGSETEDSMIRWVLALVVATLCGCASAPPTTPSSLFRDDLFAAPSQRIDAADVFALSAEMRRYVDSDIARRLRSQGRQTGLLDALHEKGQLKLDYDTAMTRNASEAFAARSGNCLSLVIMTAAFAKEMGLGVRFQSVLVEDNWTRSGDIYLSVGHVNLVLGPKGIFGYGRADAESLTIDFLPPPDARRLRTRVVGEHTIVAMYMNNRAVESMTQGRLDDAYWWAREAVRQDPWFLSAQNTLGVVYRMRGRVEESMRVFRDVLEREPGNVHAIANLASLLEGFGRFDEARTLKRRLAELEPIPPFSFFNRGVAAMRAGDYRSARDLFAKEVDRAAYYHEFHFWLAAALFELGDTEEALKHMKTAVETSTTRDDRELYSAKLARLRSGSMH
jgi:tetratricopeptide (TPR) repeat protein